MTDGCRHNVNQSNIRYSDIKQSLSRDKDSTNIKLVEPEQEAAETVYVYYLILFRVLIAPWVHQRMLSAQY